MGKMPEAQNFLIPPRTFEKLPDLYFLFVLPAKQKPGICIAFPALLAIAAVAAA